MRRSHPPHIALLLCSLAAPACDVASGAPSPVPSSDDVTAPAVADAVRSEPVAPQQPDPPVELPGSTNSPVPSPEAEDRDSLVDRATTTVTRSVGRGLGAARSLLPEPSDPPKALELREPAPARAPAKPVSRGTPASRSSSKACDIESHRWKSARIPLPGNESKKVKLKNGSWDGSTEDECYWVSLVEGPQLGDLNRDGRAEAYLIVGEVIASTDSEGLCSLGMSDTSEALFAFDLDDKCKPRMLDLVDEVGQCEFGDCEDLSLRIQGEHVVYGRQRFGWSGESLKPIR
jgi:hypothetical protein